MNHTRTGETSQKVVTSRLGLDLSGRGSDAALLAPSFVPPGTRIARTLPPTDKSVGYFLSPSGLQWSARGEVADAFDAGMGQRGTEAVETLRKRALLLLGCLLIVGALFIAPRASAQTNNLLPIRIGYQSTPNWLLLVAKNMNLFEKAGLSATFEKFTAGLPMIAAAQTDQIDLGDVGNVPFLVGLSQGLDWVMIGISDEGAYTEGLVARKDSGIKSFADLKGKRVGFFKGSTAHFGLVMALRQTGIRPDQVELIPMTPAEQLAAIITNRIDAAMTWEPWMQNMVHQAEAKIVTTEGDLGIYTNVDGYAVRKAWLLAHRETAVRFLRALRMAFDLVQRDRGLAISTVAREMNMKESWLKTIYKDDPPPNLDWWSDRAYQYSLVEGAAFHRRLGYLATFLYEEKIITKELDVSEVLDVSVITDAMTPSADAAAAAKKTAAQ